MCYTGRCGWERWGGACKSGEKYPKGCLLAEPEEGEEEESEDAQGN